LIFVKARRNQNDRKGAMKGVYAMLDQPYRSQSGSRGSVDFQVPGPGMAALFNVWTPTAACLESCNAATYRASNEIIQSWLKFIGDRLAKDSAFPQQVASCHTFNDFSVVYAQFWQQAVRDYTAEFTALANLGWGAVQSVLQAAGEQNPGALKS
jgi:hypothetical protein